MNNQSSVEYLHLLVSVCSRPHFEALWSARLHTASRKRQVAATQTHSGLVQTKFKGPMLATLCELLSRCIYLTNKSFISEIKLKQNFWKKCQARWLAVLRSILDSSALRQQLPRRSRGRWLSLALNSFGRNLGFSETLTLFLAEH